jgi:hypothetical protein
MAGDIEISAMACTVAERLESIVQEVRELWTDGRTAIYSDADLITILGAIELLRKI